MARLCVRVTPNNHPTDESLNGLRFQPGDVVCLVSDDHQFSDGELRCGHYRVVDLPGVSQADLEHLQLNVPAFDKDGNLAAKRAVAVDHNANLKLPPLTDDIISLSVFRDNAEKLAEVAAAAAEVALLADEEEKEEAVAIAVAAKAAAEKAASFASAPILKNYISESVAALSEIVATRQPWQP